MRRLMLVSLVLIATAAPALAQDDKKYDVNIGGGAMFPLGSFKDSFNTGGSFAIGATYFITPVLGIQGEYNYDKMNGPDRTLGLSPTPQAVINGTAVIQSNQQLNVGLFDLVARSRQRDSMVGGYVLGGGGFYHRQIQLTSPAIGYVTVCDPYWLVCYPAATAVDQILGSRSSTDFGINFGGGITFGREAKFYIEARYHYVWGPTISAPANLPAGSTPASLSTNASYFPLVFGVRF
jgi:outer membrane protein with beta-barrel domain